MTVCYARRMPAQHDAAGDKSWAFVGLDPRVSQNACLTMVIDTWVRRGRRRQCESAPLLRAQGLAARDEPRRNVARLHRSRGPRSRRTRERSCRVRVLARGFAPGTKTGTKIRHSWRSLCR